MPISEETTIYTSNGSGGMGGAEGGLGTEMQTKDVLADMEAFQREIDGLMKKDPPMS
jgi:hypothetical protein